MLRLASGLFALHITGLLVHFAAAMVLLLHLPRISFLHIRVIIG